VVNRPYARLAAKVTDVPFLMLGDPIRIQRQHQIPKNADSQGTWNNMYLMGPRASIELIIFMINAGFGWGDDANSHALYSAFFFPHLLAQNQYMSPLSSLLLLSRVQPERSSIEHRGTSSCELRRSVAEHAHKSLHLPNESQFLSRTRETN